MQEDRDRIDPDRMTIGMGVEIVVRIRLGIEDIDIGVGIVVHPHRIGIIVAEVVGIDLDLVLDPGKGIDMVIEEAEIIEEEDLALHLLDTKEKAADMEMIPISLLRWV